MVAVAVVLAATVSVLVLDFGEETTDAGPIVSDSTGEFIGDRPGADDQIVRITHIAGDDIDVSNMEIAVRACGKAERLVNLPAPTTRSSSTPTYFPFDDGNFERETGLLSQGTVGQTWNASVLHEDASDTFTAGTSFEFRINNGACSLSAGDTVTVRVIHTPTNSVLIKKELDAE